MFETNRFTFRRYLPAALLLFAAGYLSFVYGVFKTKEDSSLVSKFCYLGTSMACFGMSLLLGRLAFLPVSVMHTAASAVIHYIIVLSVYLAGYIAHRQAINATKNVRAVQNKVLMRILNQNKDTEFGRKMKFATIKDRNDYRQKVPLTTYLKDYLPYMERMEKGENNLLIKEKITRLAQSSGTTGKIKHLPVTKSEVGHFVWGFLFPFLYRHMKASKTPVAPLKMFDLQCVPVWRYTEVGIPIGPVTSHPGKQSPIFVSIGRVVPPEAQVQMPETAQMYIHFYFALCDRDLRWFAAPFGGTLVSGLKFFRENWRQLVEDVRRGKITNFNGMMPLEYYYHTLKPCPPDPVRAREIEAVCEAGFEGIIKRLWPRVESILAVVTGSHTVYRHQLEYFAGPELPLCSAVYAASEAHIAVAMNKRQDANGIYTLLPTWGFFEFIPEDKVNSEKPLTLYADEVEVGKRYEIVATSYIGFYRYRLGDIVHIIDRYNECPVLSFCTRIGGILDLRGEKTTEQIVLNAFSKTTWPENGHVMEFTSTESISFAKACPDAVEGDQGLYYVFFIEIENLTSPLNDDEIRAFDNALMDVSLVYKSFRNGNAIKPPKIFTMPPGSFETLKQFILKRNNNAASTQYKTPHYTTDAEILQLLVRSAYIRKQNEFCI